jgi:hypothetical protein
MEMFVFGGPDMNFQVKFYESDDRIEFVYGNMTLFNGANPISNNSGNAGTGSEKTLTYTCGITGFSNTASLPAGQSLIQQSQNIDNFRNVAQDNIILSPACNSTIAFVPTANPTLNASTAITYGNINAANAVPLALTNGQVNNNCDIYISQAAGAANAPTTQDDGAYFSFNNNNQQDVFVSVNSGAFFRPTVEVINSSNVIVATGTMAVSGTSLLLSAANLPSGDYTIRVYHTGSGSSSGSLGSFSIIVLTSSDEEQMEERVERVEKDS